MTLDYRERKEFKDYHEMKRLERRILFLKYLGVVIFVLFLLEFWYLQIIKGKDFAEQAENNRLKTKVLRPYRGYIRDRKGEVVANSKPSFSIVINREVGKSCTKSIEGVSGLLGLDKDDLIARAEKMKNFPDTEPLIVEEDASFDDVAVISAHLSELSDVAIMEDFKRAYSAPELAHILGYIGEVSENQLSQEKEEARKFDIAMGDIVGKAGIEKRYDAWLRGEKGSRIIEVDSMGREVKEINERKAPVPGKELNLTIDSKLQKALVEGLGGEVGAGVFMNPQNGEILALASTPLYDPNDFAGHLPSSKWREIITDGNHPLMNRAIQATYPPGSTFKVFIALTALETGVIHENTTFYCGGSAILFKRRYSCWKEGGHGTVDLHQALVHSCNVYFYNVGARLDIDDIARYAREVGFDQVTDIDLTHEVGGLVPSKAWKRKLYNDDWYQGETISVSIGQGPLQVTPLQMAVFISEIANGGYRITPVINKDEVNKSKREKITSISDETLRVIQRALRGVVNEGGTGGRAKLEGIDVCGKTGTAQLSSVTASKDTHLLPKEQKEHAWFIGYAPYENPTIAFAIIVEHGGFGGEAAAPIAKKVLERYFGVDNGEEEARPLQTAQLKENAGKTISKN